LVIEKNGMVCRTFKLKKRRGRLLKPVNLNKVYPVFTLTYRMFHNWSGIHQAVTREVISYNKC
jgi:hypothetical protein